MPRFIQVARKQEKFTVQGTGKQLRSWLYVDDAAAGIRLATEKGKVGEVYNLGTYYEKNGTFRYKRTTDTFCKRDSVVPDSAC